MGSPIPGSPCGHPLATTRQRLTGWTGSGRLATLSMWHEGPLTTQRLTLAPPHTSSQPPLRSCNNTGPLPPGTPTRPVGSSVQGSVLGA